MSDSTQARTRLMTDFQSVMADIDSLISATATKTEGEATVLRDRIRDKLDTAKEHIVDVQREAVEHARKAAAIADDYVQDHPWQAVGVAAAVGVMVGVLIGRR